jgi:hypothetical protein
MVDERDISIRGEHEALLDVADKLDAEKAALLKQFEPAITKANAAIRDGYHAVAAGVFEEVARALRAKLFIADADQWHQRSIDCCRIVASEAAPKRKRKERR